MVARLPAKCVSKGSDTSRRHFSIEYGPFYIERNLEVATLVTVNGSRSWQNLNIDMSW